MKKVIILLSVIFSNISIAQEQTDYIEHYEGMKYGAKVLGSMKTCQTFGFTVPKGFSKEWMGRHVDSFISDAVKDGINVQDAMRIMLDEMKQEVANQAYIYNTLVEKIADKIVGNLSPTEPDPTPSQIASQLVEDEDYQDWLKYWWGRCDEISQNEFGATFIAKDAALTMDVSIAKAKAHTIEGSKPKSKSKKTKKK